MRHTPLNLGIGLAAAAALGMAGGGIVMPPARDEPEFPRQHASRGKSRAGGGKRCTVGLYKGSPWAKRATRRGGNPARTGQPRTG